MAEYFTGAGGAISVLGGLLTFAAILAVAVLILVRSGRLRNCATDFGPWCREADTTWAWCRVWHARGEGADARYWREWLCPLDGRCFHELIDAHCEPQTIPILGPAPGSERMGQYNRAGLPITPPNPNED